MMPGESSGRCSVPLARCKAARGEQRGGVRGGVRGGGGGWLVGTAAVWCGELLAMFSVDGALCRIHPHKPDKAGGSLGISGG
jgi:hypothetical protein